MADLIDLEDVIMLLYCCVEHFLFYVLEFALGEIVEDKVVF